MNPGVSFYFPRHFIFNCYLYFSPLLFYEKGARKTVMYFNDLSAVIFSPVMFIVEYTTYKYMQSTTQKIHKTRARGGFAPSRLAARHDFGPHIPPPHNTRTAGPTRRVYFSIRFQSKSPNYISNVERNFPTFFRVCKCRLPTAFSSLQFDNNMWKPNISILIFRFTSFPRFRDFSPLHPTYNCFSIITQIIYSKKSNVFISKWRFRDIFRVLAVLFYLQLILVYQLTFIYSKKYY